MSLLRNSPSFVLTRRLILKSTVKQLAQARLSSTSSTMKSYLVSPAEVSEALTHSAPKQSSLVPKVIPVCGSWFLPNDPQKRSGRDVFRKAHIPHARFFDLDKVADSSSPYPHMLPSPEVFRAAMCDMGIGKDDAVVVYDTAELGIFSAPRVAWTFKVFGHPAVHILNNFKLWVEQGYATEQGEEETFTRTDYPFPRLETSRVVGFDEVKHIAQEYSKTGEKGANILDARSEGRWKGTEPEPRPGLPSGHMPGSVSVPVSDVLDPKTKTLKPREELLAVFGAKGIDPNEPIISSCGTGVTAAIIDTALREAGYQEGNRRVYDGSWTEWAQRVQPNEDLIVKTE